MDIPKTLEELRQERDTLQQAILALERLASSRGRRRGRPPKWLIALQVKRRGRPAGRNSKSKG